MKENLTWREVAKNWREGKVVFTASLGGLSPGYEQAIQVLLFEIMARWESEDLPPPDKESYPENYSQHVAQVAKELDSFWGFSGAQVGAAKATAYQFMTYGYTEMMDKLPKERLMQVSNHPIGCVCARGK